MPGTFTSNHGSLGMGCAQPKIFSWEKPVPPNLGVLFNGNGGSELIKRPKIARVSSFRSVESLLCSIIGQKMARTLSTASTASSLAKFMTSSQHFTAVPPWICTDPSPPLKVYHTNRSPFSLSGALGREGFCYGWVKDDSLKVLPCLRTMTILRVEKG